MNTTYKINGEVIPSPLIDGFAPTATDLDDADGTGLNEAGYAVRKKIRTARRQIPIQWDMLTPAQINKIKTLTDGDWFNLEYFDVFDNNIKTISLYRDTLKSQLKAVVSETESYWSLDCTFTER